MDQIWQTLAYKRRDLSDCESEPIQFCGAIQSCGWFLAISPASGEILAASENAREFHPDTMSSIVGLNVHDLLQLPDGSAFNLRDAVTTSQAGAVTVHAGKNRTPVNSSFFEAKHYICADFEPITKDVSPDSYGFVEHLRRLVFQVDLESSLEPMLGRAAAQLRALSGFDRVMIYRFEPNWDGLVIAESARTDLPPFFGLYYPASDIPAQARKLYLDSRYRMIADVDSLPVPIQTKVGLGRSELDLSCSALRAVSPFHITYLQNMGVKSSFSVPIKVNGRLWGLISCHHYDGPRFLSRELRSSLELAGQVISGRIVDQINDRRLNIRNQILVLSQSILDTVTEGRSATESFVEHAPELLAATDSQGLYVRVGGDSHCYGDTPSEAFIHKMTERLGNLTEIALWKSDKVSTDLQIDADPKGVGALAVPMSFGFEDVVIWFRPEFVREVRWGGNPNEKANPNEVLSPRASFSAWTQKVEGRSRQWSESAQEAAQNILFTFIKGIFKKAGELSRANAELARVTKVKDEFIGMVSHELRTPLGVMIGWIDILRDESAQTPMTMQALETIDRNARLQINLINDLLDVSRIISGKMRIELEPNVSLSQLIRDVTSDLRPTALAKQITLEVQNSSEIIATIDPDRMRQIVWNLISNAIKFTPKGGSVVVDTCRKGSSYQIRVKDTGIGLESDQVGRIFDRFAQIKEGTSRSGGLGLGLSIVKALVELHGGQVHAESEGIDKGSTFITTLPVFNLKQEVPEDTLPPTHVVAPAANRSLEGLNILVAEDQSDAALALDITLRRSGANTVLTANGRDALEAVKTQHFDLILSDIGMPEMDGFAFIKAVRELEADRRTNPTPAIALTAFATSKDRTLCLEAGFQNHIPKPVERQELLAVIKSLGIKG